MFKYNFKRRIAIVISKRKHIDLMRYHSLVLHKNHSAVTFAPIKYSEWRHSQRATFFSSLTNLTLKEENKQYHNSTCLSRIMVTITSEVQNWTHSCHQNYAKHMLPGHIQLTLRIFDTKRVILHLYLNLKWPNFSRLWAVHSVFIVQKQRSSCDYGIQSKSIICAKLSVWKTFTQECQDFIQRK